MLGDRDDPARSQRAHASPPVRVLAAEDVAVNRELIRLLLEARGYIVDTVCDGQEALEAVVHGGYDLVIMDMQMPVLDGLEATRAIRRMGGAYATMPIIALSANIIPDQVQLCLEAGMTAHIGKPFSSEALCAAVDRWAGRSTKPKNEILAAFVEQAGWASVRGLLDMLYAQIVAFETCPLADTQALSRQAHALRGAAGALGFGDLAAACKTVEETCNAANAPGAAMSVARAEAEASKRQIALELARAA